jgi:hypothetical protein
LFWSKIFYIFVVEIKLKRLETKQRMEQNDGIDRERLERVRQFLSEKSDEELSDIFQPKSIFPDFVKFHAIEELKKRQNARERKYSKIRAEAADVIQGHKRISRLLGQAESGRKEGGIRNVEASCLVGRDESANKTHSTRELKILQEQKLEEWAKHEKIWFSHDYIRKNWKRIDDGTSVEAEVYGFQETKTVRKVFHYDAIDSNYTPMRFIDNRISIHNGLFPETKYKLIGATKTYKGFAFVLEQPYIEGEQLTENEIDEFMETIGFFNHAGTFHWNDFYCVGDLHTKNVLRDRDGNIFVIDPVPRLNTSADEDGEAKYLPFRIVKNK